MEVAFHHDARIFDDIADEWNSLLDEERPVSLFLRVEYQRLWWECLSRGDLCIITVRDDAGRLMGVAPWFIENVDGTRTIAPVGCIDVTDYLDVVAAPGQEAALLEAVVDALDGSDAPEWEAIDLCSLPDGSPTLAYLPRLAEAKGWQVETRVQDEVPVVPLPDTFEGYMDALDGKQRRELRRKQRKAEGWPGGVEFYTVGQEHDLAAERQEYLRLMALSDPEKSEFLDERGYREFKEGLTRLAAEQGWLRLQFLRVGGERAAALFNLEYGDRVMVYNSGFDYQTYGAMSPGWVLFGYSIEDAIERGLRTYDFLRGGEDYKYRLGGQKTHVHQIVIRRR